MTFALDTMMRTFFDMFTPVPGWFQISPKKLIYRDDVAKFEVRDDLASNDPLVVLRLPLRVGSRVVGVLLVNDDISGVHSPTERPSRGDCPAHSASFSGSSGSIATGRGVSAALMRHLAMTVFDMGSPHLEETSLLRV